MGLQQQTDSAKKPKLHANKFVLGFAALAATAILGTTTMAAAAPGDQAGSGYGGGNIANVNLDLDVSGDNNVISIILNIFH